MAQSYRSLLIYEDPDQGLVEVLVRRCCDDLSEILSEVLAGSCTGPYMYL